MDIDSTINKKFTYLLAGFVCVAYVAARLWRLTDSCLWFDEIFSVHAAEHSWQTCFSFVAQDLIHPPLFYVLLKIWIAIGGESLFWLRLFPVLFSVVALIPFIYLCRELKLSLTSQLLAFIFFAVNGSLIKYAQEVRMYSVLLCVSLFSMWLFARYFNSGKRFLALVIVNILLVYTHYFGWLIVFTEVLAILLFQRIKIRRILLMFAIVFIAFLPWIFAVWHASQDNPGLEQNIGWMERPGVAAMAQFVLNLCEPFYFTSSNVDPVSVYRVTIPIFLLSTLALVFFFVNRDKDEAKQSIYLMMLFTIVPLMLVFIISWIFPYSIWGTRHLIFVFPAVFIIATIAINKIKIEWLKIAIITLVLLLVGYGFVLTSMRVARPSIWCAWENLAQSVVRSETDSPPQVYAFEDLVAYQIWFATRNAEVKPRIAKVGGIDGLTEDKAYFLPRGFDEISRINIDDIAAPKIWITFRSFQFNAAEPPLRNFLMRSYKIVETKSFATSTGTGYLVLLQKEK